MILVDWNLVYTTYLQVLSFSSKAAAYNSFRFFEPGQEFGDVPIPSPLHSDFGFCPPSPCTPLEPSFLLFLLHWELCFVDEDSRQKIHAHSLLWFWLHGQTTRYSSRTAWGYTLWKSRPGFRSSKDKFLVFKLASAHNGDLEWTKWLWSYFQEILFLTVCSIEQ